MKKLIYFTIILFIAVLIFDFHVEPAGEAKKGIEEHTVPNKFDMHGDLVEISGIYNTQPLGTPMELWMGVGNVNAGQLIGYVTFLGNPSRVVIELSDFDGVPGPDMFPFVATDIHIHFSPDVRGIPRNNKGNPVPGLFKYNIPVADQYQTRYEIPVEFNTIGAIHLTVKRYGGIDGFNFWLPNNRVNMRVVDYPSKDDPSYMRMEIDNAGFISSYDMGYGEGVYEAWCVDVDHSIRLNVNYYSYLFSSYETLPDWMIGPGKIEFPENLDKVNYIVNYYSTQKQIQPMDSSCKVSVDEANNPLTPQTITYGDIQRAIWGLIDDTQSRSGLGDWSQERVNAILCDANVNGEGFVPDCSQKVVFLAVPTNELGNYNVQILIGQPVIGQIAVTCESAAGTAWGDGKFGASFPNANQWGTYFLRNEY